MKTNLLEKITPLIEAYNETREILTTDNKAAIERWQDLAAKNNLDLSAFKTSIDEEITEIKKIAKNTGVTLNQKLKELVYNAKTAIFSEYTKSGDKPADYAQRVNNALQFLGYQLDKLDDNSAYMILKDFIDDYDQMRLFRDTIKKRNEITNANGVSLFPHTFGKLNKADEILSCFTEIEAVSESLFTHYPKIEDQNYYIGGVGYPTVFKEVYEQTEGETAVLELAKTIDSLAADLLAPIN